MNQAKVSTPGIRIDFSFSGWVRGATVHSVTVTETGEKITPNNAETLVKNLSSGVWMLDLSEHLDDGDGETEIFDFEVTDG